MLDDNALKVLIILDLQIVVYVQICLLPAFAASEAARTIISNFSSGTGSVFKARTLRRLMIAANVSINSRISSKL